jgi:hypothetical protein
MRSNEAAFTFVFVMSLFNVIVCKTSFVKDQRTDFVFPPVDQQIIAGIPEGHLRPLGNKNILCSSLLLSIIFYSGYLFH